MAEENSGPDIEIVTYASDIVSAYVSNNSLPANELPALIGGIYAALTSLARPDGAVAEAAEPVEMPSSAQIRRSVTPSGLVSFVDGKTYKTLKRHLTKHGFDPQSYRQRFGLPADYPMTSPSYSAQRSALAKEIGLGRPGGQAEREGRDAA